MEVISVTGVTHSGHAGCTCSDGCDLMVKVCLYDGSLLEKETVFLVPVGIAFDSSSSVVPSPLLVCEGLSFSHALCLLDPGNDGPGGLS